MGQPSKPTSSSSTLPENRARLLSLSRQLHSAGTHTHFYTFSPGIPTSPPPLSYGSPYSRSPLPPAAQPFHNPMDVSVGVHPHLRFSHALRIVWNVELPCSSITTVDRQYLTPQALSEPATNPRCPALTIISFQLPWSIEVGASSQEAGAYVTVSDVLSTIHRALQLDVTPFELNLLPSREVKDGISAAHASRIGGRAEGEGTSQEVKRVDYLMGETWFLGLSSTQFGPGVLALNVSSLG